MKPRIKIKLRGQLLIATGLLVLLPLLLISYLVDMRVNKTMTNQVLSHNAYIGELVKAEVLRFVDHEKHTLEVASATSDLWNSAERPKRLAQIYNLAGHWQKVYFAEVKTGKIISSYPTNNSDFDARNRDWFHRALVNPGVSVSEIYTDSTSGKNFITFSTVIRDNSGKLIGVLAADLSREDLRKNLENHISIFSGIDLWLIDPLGHFLLKPDNGSFPETTSYTKSFINELKFTHLVSETDIPGVDWLAIIAQQSDAALSNVHQLSMEIAVLTFFFFLLAIIGVLIYVYRLTKPIDVLLERIHAIEEGACFRDFPPLRTRFDEIGEVAQAFDKVTEELQELLRDVITTLTTTLDARDPYTRHHSERVSLYAYLLAQHLEWPVLESENVLRAGLMHDVGKIGVPEQILNKPGSLTEEEYTKMKTHSQGSYDIIQRIPFYVKLGIAEMVLEHHERWDGKGYPHGLKGKEILPGARVLAIADAFDAMTSDRAYRNALSIEEALRELHKGAGKQFDPEMVAVFLSIPKDTLIEYMETTLEAHMNRVPLTAV